MPSTSGAWGAEADTSRHVSPGCVLAGASYFCCVLTPSGSWASCTCALFFWLLGKSWISITPTIQFPGSWRVTWSAVPKTGRLCISSASTAWNWENLQSTRKTLFCPITAHLPSPHKALGGADFNQNSKQGSGAWASPVTASPVTDSWVTPVPATSSLHTTATQTNPSPISSTFSLLLPTVSWGHKDCPSLYLLYLKLWLDLLNLPVLCWAQLSLTICDPMDCSPSGSSVHEILQAKILEWVAIPFSRGSSQPRDGNWVSFIAGRFFTIWPTGEALSPIQTLDLLRKDPCWFWSLHHLVQLLISKGAAEPSLSSGWVQIFVLLDLCDFWASN